MLSDIDHPILRGNADLRRYAHVPQLGGRHFLKDKLMTVFLTHLKRAVVVGVLVTSAMPVWAADGQAWGGRCVVSGGSGSLNDAACTDEGVSCSGSGTGGTACTWSVTGSGGLDRIEEAIIVRNPEAGAVADAPRAGVPLRRVLNTNPALRAAPSE